MDTLQPSYPSDGRTFQSSTVAKAVQSGAVEQLNLTTETLPEELRMKYRTGGVQLCASRYPFSQKIKKCFTAARERLVFEEFLEFILSLRKLRRQE